MTTTSDDEYKWPTLAEEGMDMIYASTLMYGLASLRDLARQNELTEGEDSNERILRLPITVDDVIEIAEANKDILMKHFSDDDNTLYAEALLYSLQSDRRRKEDSAGEEEVLKSQVVVFDDEHSRNELVYGIEISHPHKRITVGFRGSVTVKDFMVDAKAYMCEIPNPLEPASGAMIAIHHGFYEYLFETKSSSKASKGGNKCDTILEQLAKLFEQFPHYRLYVTGHSLGGALATLLGTECAASEDTRIPKPITVIAVASPKVGNPGFQKAFQSLERQGLLRCLRLQNRADAVTVLPDQSTDLRCFSCGDHKLYKHAGLELTIDKNGSPEFAYSRAKSGGFSRVMKNGITGFGHSTGVVIMLPVMMFHAREFLKNHGPAEYARRLAKFSECNGDIFLNDVYRDDVPDCDGEFEIQLATM